MVTFIEPRKLGLTDEDADSIYETLNHAQVAAVFHITEISTRQAVKKALKRQRRQALLGFLSLFAGLMIAVAIQQRDSSNAREAIVQSGTVVAVEGCNRDFKQDMRSRRTYVRARNATVAAHRTGLSSQSPGQYRAALAFYDGEIGDIDKDLPDCREDLTIITTDPSSQKKPVIPPPLYPGSPEAKRLAVLKQR